MGGFCVVCKKEPIPGNRARSFHTFPKDALLKQQWIDKLGISPKSKFSRVCSDHFHLESFHYIHGNRVKKRLLRDAVPFRQAEQEKLADQRIAVNDQIIEDSQTNSSCNIVSEISRFRDYVSGYKCDVTLEECNEITVIDGEECSEESPIIVEDHNIETNQTITDNNSELSGLEECNERLSTVGDLEECNDELPTIVGENQEVSTTVKKPKFKIDVSRFTANKTFRFMDGVQPSSVSRADFRSDDAWTRFLKLMVYKNSRIKTFTMRNFRQKKRIRELQDVVKVLGNDEESETVIVHVI